MRMTDLSRIAFLGAILAYLVFLVVVMLMTTPPALAAVTVSDVIEPLRPYLLEVAGVLITGVVAWAAKRFRDWTGMEIEARHREALQSALTNAARLALDRGAAHAGEMRIPIGNAVLETGVDYVLKSVPDAVKHFGLSPERVAELIRPKLLPAPRG
jgi:hypothetical protein